MFLNIDPTLWKNSNNGVEKDNCHQYQGDVLDRGSSSLAWNVGVATNGLVSYKGHAFNKSIIFSSIFIDHLREKWVIGDAEAK